MVVPINVSEKCRNNLGVLICIFSCLMALSGLALLVLGLFIQLEINDRLLLLESYNEGILPNFLVGVGSVLILINIACAKFSYDCGYARTREKFRMVLVPLLVVLFLTLWVTLAGAIFCMVSRKHIEDALHNGLEDAMSRYKHNLKLKVELDRLQMKNRCCGSKAYTDWFNVGWINPEFVNKDNSYVKTKLQGDGTIHVDSVPFSCCDVKASRPCVSNYVIDKTRHVNYVTPTLYMNGCTDKLMDTLENVILFPAGCFVFALFGVEFLVFVLVRYLQTSIVSAYEEGNPLGPGKGFLFPDCCKACTTGNAEKYVKQGALDPSKRAPPGSEDTSYDVIDMEGAPDFGGGVPEGYGGQDGAYDSLGGADPGDMGGYEGHGDHGGLHDHRSSGHSGGKQSNDGGGGKTKSKWSPKKPKFLKSKKPKLPKMKRPKKPKAPKSPKKSGKKKSRK